LATHPFNLLAEFQHAAGLPVYREPPIRTRVLTCGATPGRAGRQLVTLSESWGGLKMRNPLPDSFKALRIQLRRSWIRIYRLTARILAASASVIMTVSGSIGDATKPYFS